MYKYIGGCFPCFFSVKDEQEYILDEFHENLKKEVEKHMDKTKEEIENHIEKIKKHVSFK